MKTRFSSRLLKVIGLTTTVAGAIVMSLTANPVGAEPSKGAGPNMILNKPTSVTLPQPFPELQGINLTAEQQEQIWQIRLEMQPEFKAILPRPELTSKQREQLESGQPIQITLTPPSAEQKAQLKQLMQTYRQKIEAILTPEQQEQFRQNQNRDMFLFEGTRDN